MMTPEELAPAFKGRPHLVGLLQKISSGASDFTPEEEIEIVLAEARVNQLRGEIPLALEQGQRALEHARQRNYSNGIVAALVNLSFTHYYCNTYTRAVEFAKEALEHDSDAPDSAAALTALGLCAFDTNDWRKAASCYEQALNLSRRLGQSWHQSTALHNLSLLYRDRGEFDLALVAVNEYQRLMQELGILSDRIPMGRAWIHLITDNRVSARQALADLEPFVATSRLAAGAYHVCHARLAMDEDDLEQAERELRRERENAETTGMGKLNHFMRAAMSRLRRLQGNAAGAMSWANEALAFAQRYTSQFEKGVALVERARAWWMLDDQTATEKDLLAALDIAQKLGAEYLAAEATFLLAALRHQQERRDLEAAWLEAARRIKIGGYGFILERERALAFPLVAAQAHSRDPEVRAAATTMLDILPKIAPLPLRVVGLGRFEVWQGRRKILDGEWQKRRAGELFRFLLLQPNHSVTRDILFDAFVPDQSPAAAQNFLHHATSILRRILEPELPEKFPSRYLFVEGDQVELRLPSGSLLDWEEFEQGLSAADEKTLALYQGDLFPLDWYADWAADARERFAELHRRALLESAQKKMTEGNPQAALDAARQILSSNPWREDAALIAMKACIALNDRPGALRLYHDLERDLNNDLQISPRADLQELAASLRK